MDKDKVLNDFKNYLNDINIPREDVTDNIVNDYITDLSNDIESEKDVDNLNEIEDIIRTEYDYEISINYEDDFDDTNYGYDYDKTVTEWQILFSMTSGKEDFYTEIKEEYDDMFQDLIDNGELDTVEQCLRKEYVWNNETEDYEETDVEILYDIDNYDDYVDTKRADSLEENIKLNEYNEGTDFGEYTRLVNEIKLQAENKGYNLSDEDIKKIADKMVDEDNFFYDYELPEPDDIDNENWEKIHNVINDYLKSNKKNINTESVKVEENKTEEYWDATEIARDGFMSLMKFNFGYDSKGNNYIITVDANDVCRFVGRDDEYAKEQFEKFKKEWNNTDHADLTTNIGSIAPRTESYVSYEEPFNGKSMSKEQWQEYYEKEIDKNEWSDFDSWWYDMTQKDKLIIEESKEKTKYEVESYHLEDMGGHTMAVFGKLKDGNYFAGNEEFINIYDEDMWSQLCEDDPDTTIWEQEHLVKNLSGEYSNNREENKEYFDIISQTSFFSEENLDWKKEQLGLDTLEESKRIATNIEWDTDGEDIYLPTEIEIPDDIIDEDEISDYITNETGFCHKGFEIKTEGKVTTPKGEFDVEEINNAEKEMQQAFIDYWSDKITMQELENKKKELGKYLTYGQISNCQYNASLQYKKENKEIKTEVNNKADKLKETVISNFNIAYEEWGKENSSSKIDFIDKFIDAEFWDMGADFEDYEDWKDYIEVIPALKNFDETIPDYDLDIDDLTAIKRNIANWERKLLNDYVKSIKTESNNIEPESKEIIQARDTYKKSLERELEIIQNRIGNAGPDDISGLEDKRDFIVDKLDQLESLDKKVESTTNNMTIETLISYLGINNLDTEYREAFASALLKYKYVNETPVNLNDENLLSKKLSQDEVKQIVDFMIDQMKDDFQFEDFMEYVNAYIYDNIEKKTEVEEENTIKEILDRYKGEYVDYEFYEYIGNNKKIHTDTIKSIDISPVEYKNYIVEDYELMTEDDYDISILANSSVRADFNEWYGDANSKVLVIIVKPVLDENKKVTEAEDMTQVKDEIEKAKEDTDNTKQEIEQVKGSLEVLKTDEEEAIAGYDTFIDNAKNVVDDKLANALDDQMEEIIQDEKDHIEKLDTMKSALGESKQEDEDLLTEAINIKGVTEVPDDLYRTKKSNLLINPKEKGNGDLWKVKLGLFSNEIYNTAPTYYVYANNESDAIRDVVVFIQKHSDGPVDLVKDIDNMESYIMKHYADEYYKYADIDTSNPDEDDSDKLTPLEFALEKGFIPVFDDAELEYDCYINGNGMTLEKVQDKKTEAVDVEQEKEKVEQDIQETGTQDMIDTEKELIDGIKKEIYQYTKQQGLDLEKLRKQGIELDTIADTIDKVVGDMVSKSAIEFMDQTGQDINWDFEIKDNDIHIVWNNK